MEKNIFTINGSKISNKHSFFKIISQVIFPDFEWKNGYSFDVLADILTGGYGLIDDKETYTICWQNFKSSARKMEEKLLLDILSVFDNLERVTLILA